MNAFDLQDEFDRYRSEGGLVRFPDWCARYSDDYGCDGEWFAEDYLGVVRRHEVADTSPPSFRVWLEGETAEYRLAHIDEMSDS